MKKSTIRVLQSAGMIAFIIVFLLLLGSRYLNGMQQYMQENTNRNLNEIAQQGARLVQNKVNNDISYLTNVGQNIARNIDSEAEVVEMLSTDSRASNFEQISFASLDGYVFKKDSETVNNISQREYFIKAISGKDVIDTGVTSIENSDKEVVLIAVPAYNSSHKIVGAVFGQYEVEEFNKLLSVTTFDGKGYNYIAGSDGKVFVWSDHKDVDREFQNVAEDFDDSNFKNVNDLPKMLINMANNQSGEISYECDGVGRIMNYTPIGISNWYLLSVVPREVVTSKTSYLFYQAMMFMMCAFVLLGLPILYVWHLQHKDERNRRINQNRIDIIMEQTQDIVFEWNLKSNGVYYSPIFKKKFGYEPLHDNFPFSVIDNHYIKSEDKAEFLAMFDRIRNGEKTTVTEVRVHCNLPEAEEKYVWCRIVGTAVMDDNDMPIRCIGIISDIEEQKRRLMKIKDSARRDGLTELYNKKATEEFVVDYMQKCDKPAAFIMLDIDNFKHINDTLGHLYGDKVLRETAMSLKSAFRSTDIIGRIGGDEFIVFIGNIEDDDILHHKLHDILAVFKRTVGQKNEMCNISCSIGVARFPQDGTTYSDLYTRADGALYCAKESGKNQYAIYSHQLLLDKQWNQEKNRVASPQSEYTSCCENIGNYMSRLMENNPNLDETVPAIFRIVSTLFSIDHVYVLEVDSPNMKMTMTYEWAANEKECFKEHCQNVELMTWKDTVEQFKDHPIYYYKRGQDAEIDRMIQAQKRQVASAVWCIMKQGSEHGVMVCFEQETEEQTFSRAAFNILPMIATHISEAILYREKTSQEPENLPPLHCCVIDVDNRTILGGDVLGDFVGQSCYSVIEKQDTVCTNCPIIGDLTKGSFLNYHKQIQGKEFCIWSSVVTQDERELALICYREI